MNFVSIAQKAARFTERVLLGKKMVLIRAMAHLDCPRHVMSNFQERQWEYVRFMALDLAAHEIHTRDITGNIAELGVYKGTFAKALNEAFPDRKLYLFDTFEGYADEDLQKDHSSDKAKGYAAPDYNWADTSVQLVLDRMSKPENCIVKKGYFPETAEGLEDEFAFVSIDANLYKPTIEGLDYFYARLSRGGYIFLHDYNNELDEGVKQAVLEFCEKNDVGFVPLCDPCGTAIIVK